MNKRIVTMLAVGAMLALGSGSAMATSLGNPPVGSSAPDFSVTGQNGKPYKLSALKGKIVVLEWMNPGCPFSRAQYDGGNTQSLEKKYGAKGVIWLSVNSSAAGKEGSFETDKDADAYLSSKSASPAAVVRDLDGTLGKLYGAKTTPHIFVINAKGTLVYKGAMDDTPSTDADTVAKSHNWVSAALDNLLAGKSVAVPETKPYGCGVKYRD
jgi:peroxiredoxin